MYCDVRVLCCCYYLLWLWLGRSVHLLIYSVSSLKLSYTIFFYHYYCYYCYAGVHLRTDIITYSWTRGMYVVQRQCARFQCAPRSLSKQSKTMMMVFFIRSVLNFGWRWIWAARHIGIMFSQEKEKERQTVNMDLIFIWYSSVAGYM